MIDCNSRLCEYGQVKTLTLLGMTKIMCHLEIGGKLVCVKRDVNFASILCSPKTVNWKRYKNPPWKIKESTAIMFYALGK